MGKVGDLLGNRSELEEELVEVSKLGDWLGKRPSEIEDLLGKASGVGEGFGNEFELGEELGNGLEVVG